MSTENLEVVRQAIDAYNRRDFEAGMAFYSADYVFDATHRGFGVFEGRALARRVAEAWVRAFDEFEIDLREVSDLGNGVIFTVHEAFFQAPTHTSRTGRPLSSCSRTAR